MPYLGRSNTGFGIRDRFQFTASGSETTISGSDDNGRTLKFSDGKYVDVYLNGVMLDSANDYNTSTANTIGGLTALTANDYMEIISYDIFSIADVVPASGGTFSGNVTAASNFTVSGKTFLIAICDHMYSGRFGTFLDDLSKDRMERNRQEKTESIWTYLCAKHRIYRYKNLYYPLAVI